MFGSWSRSWNLAKESLRVLRKDPELMLFPIVAFITGVVLAGVFGGLGFAVGGFSNEGVTASGIFFVILFYFLAYFATIYFQVALVASVKLRLSGGDPTLRYGIAEANKRLGAIISWAILAALVGLLLRLLDEAVRRNSSGIGQIVGRIVIGLIGVAWSLAVFFVIPIIAYEGVGGLEALKRSAGIVKKRWGEAVVGQGGIGIVMWLAAIVVGLVFIGLGALLVSAGGAGLVIGIMLIVVGVLGVAFIIAVGTTLESIYTTVLYQYATTGRVGQEFSQSALDTAFKATPPQRSTWA